MRVSASKTRNRRTPDGHRDIIQDCRVSAMLGVRYPPGHHIRSMFSGVRTKVSATARPFGTRGSPQAGAPSLSRGSGDGNETNKETKIMTITIPFPVLLLALMFATSWTLGLLACQDAL